MSKRNRKSPKKYEREGLNSLVEYVKKMRPKPLPQIDPTSYKLEEAIGKLPRTLKEPLEKFFGLLPGKINHYEVMVKSQKIDLASSQMELRAQNSIKKLISLDYLRMYDKNFLKLCNSFIGKIDNSLNLEDSVCLKYLLAYFIIMLDGSNLFFDSNEENNPDLYKYDHVMALDTYAILNIAWKKFFSAIEDNSFNIKLVVEWVENLELYQKAKVLQAVDLDIPYELRDYVSNVPPHFIDQIRQLKEDIFPNGPWRIIERLVFEDATKEFDFSEFAKLICSDSNWVTVAYQASGKSNLRLSTGTRELEVYNLGNLQFTDPHELDFLYLERNVVNF